MVESDLPENLPVPLSVRKSPIVAGAMPQAIVPVDFESVWRLAQCIHDAGMAPREFDSISKITVVIMQGLEIGIPPMQALQSIALINNRPTIWGDLPLAMVFKSNLMEAFEETKVEKDNTIIAICVVKRKGYKQQQGQFSMKQAAEAGLLNSKSTTWKLYPDRMLQLRARAFALRDAFPDVLKGITIGEEYEGHTIEGVAVEVPTPAPTIIREAIKQNGQKKNDNLEIPAELDRRPKPQERQAFAASPAEHAWIEKVAKGLAACKDHDSFNKFVTEVVNPGNKEFRAQVQTHIEERVTIAWKKLSAELLGKKADAGSVDAPGADTQTLGPDRA